MINEEEKLDPGERRIFAGFILAMIYGTLNLTLRYGFSIDSPLSTSLVALIALLLVYPIGFRGTENRFRKGKQWTLLSYAAIYVVPFTVLSFIMAAIIRWFFRG